MERNFETVLAEQCAPTLAGIKPANLFTWTDAKKANLSYWRGIMSPYGLTLRILKVCPVSGKCLIYLFRKAWLCEILAEPSVRAFLNRLGYPDADCSTLLHCLSGRLRSGEEFPHEIGIFLGYPLEDVEGFMENHGKNCACCGCWKVYGNPAQARQRFAEYHRCTDFYCEKVRTGTPLSCLIASAG